MTKYITKITKMTEYIRNTLVFLFSLKMEQRLGKKHDVTSAFLKMFD